MARGISVYLTDEEYRQLSGYIFSQIINRKKSIDSDFCSETQKKYYQDEIDIDSGIGFKLQNAWYAAQGLKKDNDIKSYLDRIYAVLEKEAL